MPLGAFKAALMGAASGVFSATGGTETAYTGYKVHTFTSSGDFVVGGSGGEVDILIVGAGGGGGRGNGAYGGGGGGGGGFKYFSGKELTASTTYAVVIGAGAVYQSVSSGGNSSFGSDVALGGGTGRISGSDGGSGGGGSYSPTPGKSGTANQGNDGGNGFNGTSGGNFYRMGGGGGGAAAAGTNAAVNQAGNGGAGYSTGATVYDWNLADGTTVTFPANFTDGSTTTGYAGGGGGEAQYNTSSVSHGGGLEYSPGSANTGGGAGGGSDGSGNPGGTGGSGIVIIRYAV